MQGFFRHLTKPTDLNGYYVPHWSYDGWGGPPYWGHLTLPAKFYGNDATTWREHYKTKYGKEPSNYGLCKMGVKQSPIDISASAWAKASRSVTHADNRLARCAFHINMICQTVRRMVWT